MCLRAFHRLGRDPDAAAFPLSETLRRSFHATDQVSNAIEVGVAMVSLRHHRRVPIIPEKFGTTRGEQFARCAQSKNIRREKSSARGANREPPAFKQTNRLLGSCIWTGNCVDVWWVRVTTASRESPRSHTRTANL